MTHDIDVFDQFVNGDYRVLLPLIRRGIVHYDACDEDQGESLLIWGCRLGRDALIRLVVEKGCDVNHIAHSDGQTAVDICEERGDQPMVAYLREHGGLPRRDLPYEDDGDDEDDDTLC